LAVAAFLTPGPVQAPKITGLVSGSGLALQGGMMNRAATPAAALSLLLASSAFAGTASRSFMVGAVVVRSATVTATISATAADGVRVEQVASRGTPTPMLLVANASKPMPKSEMAQLRTPAEGHLIATVLY
jgi:hypothetical protein